MKKNLSDYVMLQKDFLSPELCKQTIDQLHYAEFIKHSYYNAYANKTDFNDHELDISFSIILNSKIIMELMYDAILHYTQNLNFEWYDSWMGYSNVRFNKYNENTQMDTHCDHIQSLFEGKHRGIPTLSIVGSLNDDYDGGEFVMFENEVIEIKAGDLIIFPSNFLYPHRINRIAKGTRYSYVSWVW